jgi:hypothetical protein
MRRKARYGRIDVNEIDVELTALPSWAAPAERMRYDFTNQPGTAAQILKQKRADTLVEPPPSTIRPRR